MDTSWISVQMQAMEIWKQCGLMVRALDLKSEDSPALSPPLCHRMNMCGVVPDLITPCLVKWPTAHHPTS